MSHIDCSIPKLEEAKAVRNLFDSQRASMSLYHVRVEHGSNQSQADTLSDGIIMRI